MRHPEMNRLLAREFERERIAQARAFRAPSEGRGADRATGAQALVRRILARALQARQEGRPAPNAQGRPSS